MASKLVHVSGKRKRSIARATLKEGKGVITINSISLPIFMPRYSRMRIEEAMQLAKDFVDVGTLDISVTATGGGVFGQADAIASAIARGLLEWTGSDELREAYHNHDRTLIAGDHRLTEPHNPGQSSKGPRHKRQKSYR